MFFRTSKRSMFPVTLAVASVAAAVLLVFVTSGAAQSPQSSTSKLSFVRTARITGGEMAGVSGTDLEVTEGPNVDSNFPKPQLSGTVSFARVPADHVPIAAGNQIVSGSFSSFLGLTHRDQRLSGTGIYTNTQFNVEPPDQGLAVGNGFVVEPVNDVIAVYSATDGSLISGPEPLNQFFGLKPAIVRSTPLVFGQDVSDPRVYFDSDTGHFFLSALEIDRDPNTSALGPNANTIIAVSRTNDPTGTWNVFMLDVTSDGDAIFGACPCFGDQPLLGADKNGIYVNTNAFTISTPHFFRGTQLYAISKQALVTGTPPTITAVRIHNLIFDNSFAFFSIQPASVPPGGSFESGNGGTEYFVSSLDVTGTLADHLAVWALTNTNSLNTTPDLHLSFGFTTTQVYGQSPSAQQKPGPTPQLDVLAAGFPLGTSQNHLELVDTGDDRMMQVVFADGNLWTGLNSVVKTREGPVRTGAAWFILSPSVSGSGKSTQVGATVANQGYVAINSPNQDNVIYPSIGVNPSGKAVIAFTVVGQDFFPSAAYATLDAVNGAGSIVISGPGTAPEDGFSGYVQFGGFRVARWGDYSAAVADEDGNIWMGNEMIPNAPRVIRANWGTFITKVIP
jgi:hypothetical protein